MEMKENVKLHTYFYSISAKQKIVAIVSEMIHTASLVHDDVIDASDTRRGLSSLNKMYGQRKVSPCQVMSLALQYDEFL